MDASGLNPKYLWYLIRDGVRYNPLTTMVVLFTVFLYAGTYYLLYKKQNAPVPEIYIVELRTSQYSPLPHPDWGSDHSSYITAYNEGKLNALPPNSSMQLVATRVYREGDNVVFDTINATTGAGSSIKFKSSYVVHVYKRTDVRPL